MVHPGYSERHRSNHLPGIGVADARQFAGVYEITALLTHQYKLVVECYIIHLSDVDHDCVHCHGTDQRHPTSSHEHLTTWLVRARKAIAVADWQGGDDRLRPSHPCPALAQLR